MNSGSNREHFYANGGYDPSPSGLMQGGWETSVMGQVNWAGTPGFNTSCIGYFGGDGTRNKCSTPTPGATTVFVTIGGVGTTAENIPSVQTLKAKVQEVNAKGIIYDFEGALAYASAAQPFIKGIPGIWHIACPLGHPTYYEPASGYGKDQGFTHIAPMMYGGNSYSQGGWTLDAVKRCAALAKGMGYSKKETFITFQATAIVAPDANDIAEWLKSQKVSYLGLIGWGSTVKSINHQAGEILFT
jgi:hypothetical protein